MNASTAKLNASRLRPHTGLRVTRTACKFPGCVMPPRFRGGRPGADIVCEAHAKQRTRGGPLRPFVPRSDVEAAWRRYHEERARRLQNWQRTRGAPYVCLFCDTATKVRVTHVNGRRGLRYCWCSTCERHVYFQGRRFLEPSSARGGV